METSFPKSWGTPSHHPVVMAMTIVLKAMVTTGVPANIFLDTSKYGEIWKLGKIPECKRFVMIFPQKGK